MEIFAQCLAMSMAISFHSFLRFLKLGLNKLLRQILFQFVWHWQLLGEIF